MQLMTQSNDSLYNLTLLGTDQLAAQTTNNTAHWTINVRFLRGRDYDSLVYQKNPDLR